MNAAEVILERPQVIEVGGRKYKVSPPTVATLIMVSEVISTFPCVDAKDYDGSKTLSFVLGSARDYKRLGEVVSILILGAHRTSWWRSLLGYNTKYRRLGKELLSTLSPTQLFNLFMTLMRGMEVGSFFGFTTSLNEANLLRKTVV